MEDNNNEEGTLVANGSHVVPAGVAVEELASKKDLAHHCPPAVVELLAKNTGMREVYDQLIESLTKDSGTHTTFGKWKDDSVVGRLKLFEERFAAGGIQVAFCKRSSAAGKYRWLEFIDKEVATTYVPQYDVANRSGQIISTMYNKLKFPNGVAVEELKDWKGGKRLKEKCPSYVQVMLEKKNAQAEYDALVNDLVETTAGPRFTNWDVETLQPVIERHRPAFEAKDMALFLGHKQEWIHTNTGGFYDHWRWIEFVDRAQQPNYYPQRDGDSKVEKKNCVIM